jgi:uncharacterized protein
MKQLTLAPYHLFRFRDSYYILDIGTSAVVRLDQPAHDALSLQLTGASPVAIAGHLTAAYGEEVCHTVQRELGWLGRNGIFVGPVATHDDQENQAYIQRLAGMSTNRIELYLAEACNLRCRYCYVDGNAALNNGLMPWEIARQAIELVFGRAGDAEEVYITFFGGEPLLNKPVLRRAIEYSQKLGVERGKRVSYSMTTNATLLDDEIIGLIKRYNFGLMISLDGPREIHDRMRPFAGGQGSFDRAATQVKRLMERRGSVTVRCTLSNQCLDRPGIVEFLENFGFARVAMSRCTGTVDHRGPYDLGPEENVVLKEQDRYFMDRLLGQLSRGDRIRFNPWASAIRNIHDRQNRRMRCGVGRGCTTVGVDGRLYPCHRYIGMEPYVLGHVSTGIDQRKLVSYLQGYFATKAKCEHCWAINICGGYCPWYVSCRDGCFQPPQDWWCEEVLGWYEQAIWLYDTLRAGYPDYFRQLVGDGLGSEPVLR